MKALCVLAIAISIVTETAVATSALAFAPGTVKLMIQPAQLETITNKLLIEREDMNMANRMELNEELLDGVVGGNLTYTWFGGQGTCGLNNNNKWKFTDKNAFENMMNDCMRTKGMTDVETLQAMLAAGIIWK